MSTKFDNRVTLIKMLECLDDYEAQQLLAFAAGYEAGKLSNASESIGDNNFRNRFPHNLYKNTDIHNK